jgi:hypothetical protein
VKECRLGRRMRMKTKDSNKSHNQLRIYITYVQQEIRQRPNKRDRDR